MTTGIYRYIVITNYANTKSDALTKAKQQPALILFVLKINGDGKNYDYIVELRALFQKYFMEIVDLVFIYLSRVFYEKIKIFNRFIKQEVLALTCMSVYDIVGIG